MDEGWNRAAYDFGREMDHDHDRNWVNHYRALMGKPSTKVHLNGSAFDTRSLVPAQHNHCEKHNNLITPSNKKAKRPPLRPHKKLYSNV